MISAAGANPAISVTRFSHSFNQPSVIAKIPGSSSDALVIVGAHLDSTGGSSSARGPGAGKQLPDPKVKSPQQESSRIWTLFPASAATLLVSTQAMTRLWLFPH